MAEVQSRRHEFEAAGSNVIIISFGKKDGAERWLETSGCSFPMYLDRERNLYQKFSLPKSMKQVWTIKSMTHYAEYVRQGRKFFNSEEGDDPHQLGGDFVVNKNGVVRFIYRSKSPMDRPALDDLLAVLR